MVIKICFIVFVILYILLYIKTIEYIKDNQLLCEILNKMSEFQKRLVDENEKNVELVRDYENNTVIVYIGSDDVFVTAKNSTCDFKIQIAKSETKTGAELRKELQENFDIAEVMKNE